MCYMYLSEDEFTKKSCIDIETLDKKFEDLVPAWRNGDATQMLKEINTMQNDYPALYKSLLVERNNNWLPKIEAYFNTDKTPFVLVGALHLYGNDGLLEQLKSKGYTVDQLP